LWNSTLMGRRFWTGHHGKGAEATRASPLQISQDFKVVFCSFLAFL
jgi:hypothetical protein